MRLLPSFVPPPLQGYKTARIDGSTDVTKRQVRTACTACPGKRVRITAQLVVG